MRSERAIQGRGLLECSGRTTTATYTLILSSDDLGNLNATGLLPDVDIAFAIDPSLSGSLGRLRLEDNQEIVVRITPRDDGSLLVQSTEAFPDFDQQPSPALGNGHP
jgi:hypothetical protein